MDLFRYAGFEQPHNNIQPRVCTGIKHQYAMNMIGHHLENIHLHLLIVHGKFLQMLLYDFTIGTQLIPPAKYALFIVRTDRNKVVIFRCVIIPRQAGRFAGIKFHKHTYLNYCGG